MAVGERNVREEIRNCISKYVVTAIIGLLKNMIKLTGWNVIIMDISLIDLWNPIVKRLIFRTSYVRSYLSSQTKAVF